MTGCGALVTCPREVDVVLDLVIDPLRQLGRALVEAGHSRLLTGECALGLERERAANAPDLA